MSTYPITVSTVNLKHRGGTKFYTFLLAQTADGKGLLIKRYGKVGTFGQIIEERYDTYKGAEKAFEKTFDEKTSGRKGYEVDGATRELTVSGPGDLLTVFGRMLWPKLSAATVKHLDPSYDTTGRREPDPPRFGEDGEYLGEPEPRTLSPEEVETAKQAAIDEEKAKRAAIYAENENFGRF